MTKHELLFEPTPHSSWLRFLTPESAYDLLNSIKSQAMKDYINALSKLRYDPDDHRAADTIRECEELFSDANKLDIVKKKVKYDGGMFEILCMETFPEKWGEALPTKEHMMKCPICKDGRINRSFRPQKADSKTDKDPRIICSCDVCTYKYVQHVWKMEDYYMKKVKEQLKRAALAERDRLCKQEINDILLSHPEYTQAEIDTVYRRISAKWKV